MTDSRRRHKHPQPDTTTDASHAWGSSGYTAALHSVTRPTVDCLSLELDTRLLLIHTQELHIAVRSATAEFLALYVHQMTAAYVPPGF